ncbi:hypothetical protein V1514DRAFT_349943 [Lipomyces japonicus]|uniref:uncharacterized protein n=1 Tax=Lipomyces japonicus TaxID=56871 RepID=UPI0034CD3D35
MGLFAFLNSLFSVVLFIGAVAGLVVTYKWALKPLLLRYNVSIPLRDLPDRIIRLGRANDGSTGRRGPIALSDDDDDDNHLLERDDVEFGAGLARVDTRGSGFGWEQRSALGFGRDDDGEVDQFFETATAQSRGQD